MEYIFQVSNGYLWNKIFFSFQTKSYYRYPQFFVYYHFTGPNEEYGLKNAHDKDPGGIDYEEFGWNYRKYIYPRIVPERHHYGGNAVHDDTGHGSTSEKERPKISLYIYNFGKESEKESKEDYTVRKYTKAPEKTRKKWRTFKGKKRPFYYKYRDPYEIYEPVKKHYPLYEKDIEYHVIKYVLYE